MIRDLRRALVVLAMTSFASIGLSQDVKALVRDLGNHGVAATQHARRLLREMPIDVVTAEIGRALREDPTFQQTGDRNGAYTFLTELVAERWRLKRAIDRVILEQLKVGLSEPNASTRLIVLGSLPLVEPATQKEVASWITPTLEDPSLDVATAAADALRRLEGSARDSAPALLTLLKDPDEATRRRWAAGGNGPVQMFGKTYRTEDQELVARTRAAEARLAIIDTSEDFDLYPKLDEKGQLAGMMAIVVRGDRLVPQLRKNPARARQAVALVAPLLGNAKVSKDLQCAPLMTWALIAGRLEGESMNEVRAEALARIDEATKHPDERVRKAAAGMLEEMKRRK